VIIVVWGITYVFRLLGIHISETLNKSVIIAKNIKTKTKLHGLNPQANIPTERPPLVGEVSANLCG
jgi:hypothetical protein